MSLEQYLYLCGANETIRDQIRRERQQEIERLRPVFNEMRNTTRKITERLRQAKKLR